jgi:glucose-6-phosphate 1-dehydrogenase
MAASAADVPAAGGGDRPASAKPPPQITVVFGASGDLARRKILPSLYSLSRAGMLPERHHIIGYARTDMDTDAFRAFAREAVEEFRPGLLDEEGTWEGFCESLEYVRGSYGEPGAMLHLCHRLKELDDELRTEGRRLFYLAIPPSVFADTVRRIGECDPGPQARVVIEKPFGRDLKSARELEQVLHSVFDEQQIFRIDHFLGKETVQNILVFRFANSLFERVWNRDAIDHIQLTVAESLGMEGRGSYYEESGATRDMLQNHLLQILSFLTMEPPRAWEAEAIRDEVVKVLRTLAPFEPEEAVRGQYVRGTVDGERVPGYLDEEGVPTDSETETFVAVRARIDNWRWADVPIYLRTGKRMARRATQVVVALREAPAYLFDDVGIPRLPANHLHLRIQPDEGISLAFQAKEPGTGVSVKTVRMEFAYGGSFMAEPAEAYERLILDAMVGDHMLFIREDAVERSWEVVTRLLNKPGQLHFYRAGTMGPIEADELIAPRTWHIK